MRHLDLLKLVALSSRLAFAPVHPADAAPPSERGSSPMLEATSASKIMRNGQSLNGRKANGRKMNGVSLGGHTIRTDGGMSVVSIQLPGSSTSASKLAGNGRKLNGRARNGVALAGQTVRGDGGMSVVSIRLPGAERRSK